MDENSTKRVLTLVANATAKPVTLDSSFLGLDLDSLEFLELIKDCEDEFRCHIADEAIVNFERVFDLARYIEAQTQLPV